MIDIQMIKDIYTVVSFVAFTGVSIWGMVELFWGNLDDDEDTAKEKTESAADTE